MSKQLAIARPTDTMSKLVLVIPTPLAPLLDKPNELIKRVIEAAARVADVDNSHHFMLPFWVIVI
jgi:hypothetical protein